MERKSVKEAKIKLAKFSLGMTGELEKANGRARSLSAKLDHSSTKRDGGSDNQMEYLDLEVSVILDDGESRRIYRSSMGYPSYESDSSVESILEEMLHEMFSGLRFAGLTAINMLI